MAGNTRQWAKQKIESAISHLEIAGAYLHEVEEVYKVPHPEVETVTTAVKTGLILDIEMLQHLNDTM